MHFLCTVYTLIFIKLQPEEKLQWRSLYADEFLGTGAHKKTLLEASLRIGKMTILAVGTAYVWIGEARGLEREW